MTSALKRREQDLQRAKHAFRRHRERISVTGIGIRKFGCTREGGPLFAATYALNVSPAFVPSIRMDVAILVDGTPQVDDCPVDLAECFVKKPSITGPPKQVTKAVGVRLTEFQAPQANGFVKDHHTAPQHCFLTVAKT